MRTEQDFLGPVQINDSALYGVNSLRARDNFPDRTTFSYEWFRALGAVKKACYTTYKTFKSEVKKEHDLNKVHMPMINDEVLEALITAADEVWSGEHFEHFIVPAICGGAGTSFNMNVNEIIANRALEILGLNHGNYDIVDPFEHANVFQSTNDVVPTALRIAILLRLNILEERISDLRDTILTIKKRYETTFRIGYTQMQEAVPSTFGKLFGAYDEALKRDWWRISKCFHNAKFVNLGGSAIGTGISVPKFFIEHVAKALQDITNLPLETARDLCEATSNQDVLVEIHGIIKSHAVNLEKMVGDLRMLASDLCKNRQVKIPARQVGSSIMPGKINPVIPEYVISAAAKIYANDQIVTNLCARGMLELNAYLPIIGHSILDSLTLLSGADKTIRQHLLDGIEILDLDDDVLYRSATLSTILSPCVGYHQASRISKMMKEKKIDIFEANDSLHLLPKEALKKLLAPERLLALGYCFKDIKELLESDDA